MPDTPDGYEWTELTPEEMEFTEVVSLQIQHMFHRMSARKQAIAFVTYFSWAINMAFELDVNEEWMRQTIHERYLEGHAHEN